MARIYNSFSTDSYIVDCFESSIESIETISNGNLTLVSLSLENYRAVFRFKDTGIYLRFVLSQPNSRDILEIRPGIMQDEEFTYINTFTVPSAETRAYRLRFHYSQIDDCLFSIGFSLGENYVIGSTSFYGITLFDFSIQDNSFIGVAPKHSSGFGFFSPAGSTECCCYYNKATGEFESNSASSYINKYSILGLEEATRISGEALLLPVMNYLRVSNNIAGTIKWTGHEDEHLYICCPPGAPGSLDPRQNFVINGQSYKALGGYLHLFQ